MKTPPVMGIDLLLDQEQELKSLVGKISYFDRVVTFKQMQIHPQTDNIHEFIVEVRRTEGDSKTLVPIKLKDTNSFAAFFTPWLEDPEQNPTLLVGKKEQIFLTLRKKNSHYNANISFCRVAFTLGTKF